MTESVNKRDVRNSILLSIVFFVGLLSVVITAWFLTRTVSNSVFNAQPEETFEEAPETTVGDDRVVVQVANGTNLVDRAGEVSRLLQQRDFLTLDAINADNTNESSIFYTTEGSGRLSEAEVIGAILGIDNIVPLSDEETFASFDPEAEIQIVIGRDAG